MAFQERRLRPSVAGCFQYPSYALFRSVHRHRLESNDAFYAWDAKLQLLVEREAHGSGGLQDPKEWDTFYRHVAAPIAPPFGSDGSRFMSSNASMMRKSSASKANNTSTPVLHVYTPPKPPEFKPSALPEGNELQEWEEMARVLFDENSGDTNEALWTLPPPSDPFMKRAE